MSNVVTCNINIEYHRPLTPFQMLILYLRCMNHKLSLSVTRQSSLVCRLDMYSLSLENISQSYYACAQSFRKCCAGPPHLSFTLLHRWTGAVKLSPIVQWTGRLLQQFLRNARQIVVDWMLSSSRYVFKCWQVFTV